MKDYTYKEKEINIKELAVEIIKRWRIILGGTILIVTLVGIFSFYTNYNNVELDYSTTLTDLEKEKVLEIQELEKKNIEQENKILESSLFNTNTKYIKSISLYYRFYGESSADVYSLYINNSMYAEFLSDLDAIILSTAQGDSLVVRIMCTIEESDVIVERVKSLLDDFEYGINNKTIGERTLVWLDEKDISGINYNLLLEKKKLLEYIETVKSQLVVEKNNLTQLQLNYLEQYDENKITINDGDINLWMKKVLKDTLFYGCVGFIVLCIICITIYITSDKILTESELSECFNVFYLGTIYDIYHKKKFGYKFDNLISILAGQQIIDAGEKKNYIITKIELLCKQENISQLIFVGSIQNNEIFEDLIYELAVKKVTVEFVGDIRKDSIALERVAKCKNVVILEKIGYTTKKTLLEELQLGKVYEFNIWGIVGIQ
ncbi:hypothetical protein [Lachnotalea glycerini]|uniref:Capsular polysaccharide biosynthesis protein n=1 Tax=Lachnotalea glycerini TaxID=1763509 RepID=A0A371JG39_9FIRM|nr:hypothetical protein [Lachnotalea glycerini]RDY31712.1 hypothetical protein CG710_008305 [Lachnotalea glycerini]